MINKIDSLGTPSSCDKGHKYTYYAPWLRVPWLRNLVCKTGMNLCLALCTIMLYTYHEHRRRQIEFTLYRPPSNSLRYPFTKPCDSFSPKTGVTYVESCGGEYYLPGSNYVATRFCSKIPMAKADGPQRRIRPPIRCMPHAVGAAARTLLLQGGQPSHYKATIARPQLQGKPSSPALACSLWLHAT